MLKIYKKIEIPHLNHTIIFMDMKYLKGMEKKGAGLTSISGNNEITIFIEDIEKTVKDIKKIPWVAHEIMHAIQILCEKYSMRIENEMEHTAYLMHYLLREIITKKNENNITNNAREF